MKLAIVLRGLSYYDGLENVSNSKSVNYQESLATFYENLLAPLKTVFSEIDIFLVTYNSDKLPLLLEEFKPKDILIYPRCFVTKYRNIITTKLLQDSLDLVENSKVAYDNILCTRFDLYYYKKLNMEKVNLLLINFGWEGESGQSDDNFLLFSPKYIPFLKEHLKNNVSASCHYINSIGPDKCNYISVPLNPREKRHMPDFYFFARYLEHYKDNNLLEAGINLV